MADYSDDWSCSCGAADLRNIDSHKWNCKVPERLAKSRQEQRLKREAKEQQYAEQYAQWDSLTDADLIKESDAVRKMRDDQSRIAAALTQDWHVSLDVMKKRGVFDKYVQRRVR